MIIGFGPNLKTLRNRAGLTLEELGEKVGSSKAYMWQLENKSDADPSLSLAVKLAVALDVDVKELIPS